MPTTVIDLSHLHATANVDLIGAVTANAMGLPVQYLKPSTRTWTRIKTPKFYADLAYRADPEFVSVISPAHADDTEAA